LTHHKSIPTIALTNPIKAIAYAYHQGTDLDPLLAVV